MRWRFARKGEYPTRAGGGYLVKTLFDGKFHFCSLLSHFDEMVLFPDDGGFGYSSKDNIAWVDIDWIADDEKPITEKVQDNGIRFVEITSTQARIFVKMLSDLLAMSTVGEKENMYVLLLEQLKGEISRKVSDAEGD